MLTEGENVSGTYEWHERIPMSIAYTYTFRPPSGQSAGQLEMEFELVNGDVYNELYVELVISDAARRAISGGRLFERRRRTDLSGTRRTLRMDPYSAFSFGFLGGGYFDQPRSDDLIRRSRWPN